jgi:3-oxoacyl-[acyl-carrier protein] reductase
MKRLKDKIAVITGGGTGIGYATAKKFLSEGAHTIIAEINEITGRKACDALGKHFKNIDFIQVDVSKKDSVDNLFNLVKLRQGHCDILVNNAGILLDSTLKNLDEETFQKVIDVNLKGVYLCSRAAAEIMREYGTGGVILSASSIVAHYGNFGQTVYVASKSGVIGMTKVWSRELGKYNIRVNAVAPGFIRTEMMSQLPEKIAEKLSAKVPIGRWGKAEEIANAYCFLASDEASYINGAVLNVDGGAVI